MLFTFTAISALLALPLAIAVPSPVANSSTLVTRADNILHARGSLRGKAPGGGKDNVVCGTIAVNRQKYICACYDLGEDTCYRADSKKEDNIVEDDGLISTVIRQVRSLVGIRSFGPPLGPDLSLVLVG